MNGPKLTLLIHDYDEAAALERRDQLERALPDAEAIAFHRRDEFLAAIAKLDPAPIDGPWPLALIDLQGEGQEAPGEHLLATINEHPDLTGRVALIAFTRYGFKNRSDALRAMGARAVLNPIDLDREEGLRSELQLLAEGSTEFVHIGKPAARGKDRELIRRLSFLFPELDDEGMDERARWERAREIIHICRRDREGCDDTEIKDAFGLTRRKFDKLRNQLTTNPAARRAGIMPPSGKTADLGKVIEYLRPYLDETPLIWDATIERNRLSGTGRISWVRDRVVDRYPPEVAADELHDDAWIPSFYLDALRRFLSIYDSLPKKAPAPSQKKYDPIRAALEQLAAALEVSFDCANHYVTHAVMCIEDDESERSEELAAV